MKPFTSLHKLFPTQSRNCVMLSRIRISFARELNLWYEFIRMHSMKYNAFVREFSIKITQSHSRFRFGKVMCGGELIQYQFILTIIIPISTNFQQLLFVAVCVKSTFLRFKQILSINIYRVIIQTTNPTIKTLFFIGIFFHTIFNGQTDRIVEHILMVSWRYGHIQTNSSHFMT